jgi:hypothetical protein
MNNFLSIKSITWRRDSHGLFDYECSEVKNNLLIVHDKTNLIRLNDNVIKDDNSFDESDEKFVCNISTKDTSKLSKIIF